MELTLKTLGWSPFFGRQCADELARLTPYRIAEVHRDRLTGLSEAGLSEAGPPDSGLSDSGLSGSGLSGSGLPDSGTASLITPPGITTADITVGDWVLADADHRIERVLDRQTLLQRRAPGTDARNQLIAANVDVLFITTSCNDDFNTARLERYLALAHEAGCLPVIVLTKADVVEDPDTYVHDAEALAPMQVAIAINAHDPDDLAQLAGWIGVGQTAALVGSSGVGKTTILNGLTGKDFETRTIREDDAHGRHTTTARALIPTANGGWIIDTPGMRALRLHAAEEGIEQLFADIVDLAAQCRFRDCAHQGEPGCAVQAAIADGRLEADRVARWNKLRLEDLRNSETLAQARARGRSFRRMVRSVTKEKSDRTKR
ncbi:ribosome small subunit-dependent GTPase A [Rhodalgimonas zhirmunskyi]|uniref:Small ribosomal subunit biogenesis GTPase RsgA n=1 Tax=Rhodalgimonas zhirmunskyi TaxID=2964767 RepID=A0AAJ1U5W0_9RHOB|nr:ribosome small subunit-dependent GTPase A [Rhodoalgimonas zhirmunskyi]MDQ2094180.1 ribosome small subunit-dependent GTPase A [Rhodoalgimonas zhirmunskyi]